MAENSTKFAGVKEAWSNPKARKGFLLSGGILVVLIGVAFFMSGRQQSGIPVAPSSASSVPPPTGVRDVTAQSPEQYKQLVAQADRERSEKAVGTAVVMPTLAGFTSQDEINRREAEERGRQAALAQARAQPVPVQTIAQSAGVANASGPQGPSPIDIARASIEYKKATELLAPAVVGGVYMPLTPIMNREVVRTSDQGGMVTGNTNGVITPGGQPLGSYASGNASNNLANGGLNVAKPIIRVGEIVFATTDIAMNTDYSGPVTATIRQGKFQGYRLIGLKTLERDALVVKFNLMSPLSGNTALPVSAYAVSMGDAQKFGLTGLEGETNNHVVQRYVIPAAVAFVQSYGLSGLARGATAVSGSNGAVGTTTPSLSSSDRIGIALGGAMGPLIADVTRQAARPITVSLPAQTEIGIMFATDVMPDGKMGSSAGNDASPSAMASSPFQMQGQGQGQTQNQNQNQGIQNSSASAQPPYQVFYPTPSPFTREPSANPYIVQNQSGVSR